MKTFSGHNGPVTSICCSDTQMFTGSVRPCSCCCCAVMQSRGVLARVEHIPLPIVGTIYHCLSRNVRLILFRCIGGRYCTHVDAERWSSRARGGALSPHSTVLNHSADYMRQVYEGEMSFTGHEDAISAVACMGDGGLCTGSLDGSVRCAPAVRLTRATSTWCCSQHSDSIAASSCTVEVSHCVVVWLLSSVG